MLVLVGALALTCAGLAVADDQGGGGVATAVSGTFTASAVSQSETKTCTTSTGKTLTRTKATYTGTASGAPDLTGPITFEARSTINTTDDVGVVTGRFSIETATGMSGGKFTGVYDHGSLAGLATGGGGKEDQGMALVANVSATFSATAGFSGGKIGGSSGGSAVELGPAKCASASSGGDQGGQGGQSGQSGGSDHHD